MAGIDATFFNNSVEAITMEEVRDNLGRFGSTLLYVTPEDLESLKDGKVLIYNDHDNQCASFILLKEEV